MNKDQRLLAEAYIELSSKSEPGAVERSFDDIRHYGEETGKTYKPMLKLDKNTEQHWGGIIDEI